jgi:predicted TIM-barrel fold metal-dependent hydrolase
VLLNIACASSPSSSVATQAPKVDHHQHLFSPAVAALITGDAASPGITADDVIALLDQAGIRRALVLSVAYTWGSANRTVSDEYENVKRENDWASQQVARYPDRMRVFCSVNPLKSYALAEIDRCAADVNLRRGLKLHFGNSDVDLANRDDVAQVRKIFQAASAHRMPIVVHMRTSISKKRAYGRSEALVFLNELLPAAGEMPVQIAHLGGAGGYDSDDVLEVFVDAIAKRDPRVKNLWFDVTSVVTADISPADSRLVAARLRQLGIHRILYGSDAFFGGNPAPREGWALFRTLPLTEREFRTIARNVAPYMRW